MKIIGCLLLVVACFLAPLMFYFFDERNSNAAYWTHILTIALSFLAGIIITKADAETSKGHYMERKKV